MPANSMVFPTYTQVSIYTKQHKLKNPFTQLYIHPDGHPFAQVCIHSDGQYTAYMDNSLPKNWLTSTCHFDQCTDSNKTVTYNNSQQITCTTNTFTITSVRPIVTSYEQNIIIILYIQKILSNTLVGLDLFILN